MTTELPSVDTPAKPKAKKRRVKPVKPAPKQANANSKLDVAEALCLRLSRGEELSADDFSLFEDLGWSRIEIERQTRRVANIVHLQEVAGTKSELTSRKVALQDLKQTTTEQVEQLQAEVDRMLDEIEKAKFAVRSLEMDVEARSQAMATLRERVPPHIKRVRDQLASQLSSSDFNRQRVELQSRVRALRGLPVAWSPDNHDQISHIIRSMPADERPPAILNERGQVHRDGWRKLAAERLAQLPELENELRELEAEFQERMNEIDKHLDFYLK